MPIREGKMEDQEFEIKFSKYPEYKDSTQISYISKCPLDLSQDSTEFYKILIQACSEIHKLEAELFPDGVVYIKGLNIPSGVDLCTIGPIYDLPLARMIKCYDGVRDWMYIRIDVLVKSKKEAQHPNP